jgi:hypothetical protein
MTKKELKDIILKTLEKEGGAAGIKALAKAAKTSKNKLKKDLDDMSGVKQHQDGDYISTPINEAETFTGSIEAAADFCQRCPGHMCSEINPLPGGQVSVVCAPINTDPDPEFTAFGATVPAKMVDPRYRKPMSKKPMSRKPMRLREVKEIIKVALNEKKKEMLNEVDYEYQGASYNVGAFCSNCPCGCSDVIENCVSAGGQGYACATCKENCGDTTGTSATSNIALGGKTADNKFINRPRKPMPKQQMGGAMSRCDNDSDCRGTAICVNGFCLENPNPDIPRDARLYNRRITRLREVKEIIGTMLNEKKKKKKDRCHRKADQVYGTKTSAYKSGAIVKCRKGMIWKKKK